MIPRSALGPMFCAVLLAWSAAAAAQQPKAAAKGAPSQQAAPAQKQATLEYDRYQASQRQRLRRDTCMQDEDMVAQYCVKKCQTGYIVAGGPDLPRQCRSEKPLPVGQLPSPFRIQPAIQPVPLPPSKPVPGA